MRTKFTFLFLALTVAAAACSSNKILSSQNVEKPAVAEIASAPIRSVIESIAKQTKTTTTYTPEYIAIAYPNGDVPAETGACTDVVIRSFRAAGVDLQKYFDRRGKSVPITATGEDYQPGDVVSWDLNGKGMTHIGVVSNLWKAGEKRHLIVHNIGSGVRAEDRLFEWKITGHYRYFN